MTTIPSKFFFLAIIGFAVVLSACDGLGTFHDKARAGDTVSVAAGRASYLTRGNIDVKITDSAGTITTYTPGHASVRASVNFYPDPVSSLVVSERIGKALTPHTLDYSSAVNFANGNDADWWETVVFLDLPDPMALGDATIEIIDTSGQSSETVTSTVTIVPDETGIGTGGTPNVFRAKTDGAPAFNMQDDHFKSLERLPHYEVSFSGASVPVAIQVDLIHAADEAHSGTGTPFVINPIGYIKNLSWATTGTSGTDLRVIIMPAQDGAITNMNDFKFYVAGGVTGLALNGTVQAFDNSGAPILDAVNVSISSK